MNCTHLFRFVPEGTEPSTASRTRKIPIVSQNLLPGEPELDEATTHLQKFLDPYAIRNHWSVYDCISMFKNPPWGSAISLRNKLFSAPDATNAEIKREDRETWVSLTLNSALSKEQLQKRLRIEFGKPNAEFYIVQNTKNSLDVYQYWQTSKTELE